MLSQFILIAQENYVLETFYFVFAIDLLKKLIIQLAITQNIESCVRPWSWYWNNPYFFTNMKMKVSQNWPLLTSALFTHVGSHFSNNFQVT